MKNVIIKFLKIAFFAVIAVSCEESEYSIPVPEPGLHNDCIKHSLGPNMVGQNMVFAYAVAINPEEGKLLTATVEAAYAGAEGTYLDNKSYHTDGSGQNIGIEIGAASVTSGNKTTVTFSKDTCAATLRFYYKVPEEARGKKISFKFSATADNGQTISCDMGPYDVRKMDLALNLVATDGNACYISIEDMAVYDAIAAAANPSKIDLVYLYRSVSGVAFGHALVSPSTDPQYLPGVTLPSGVTNRSKVIKAWNIQDQQLANLQYTVFVDDLDLEQKSFTDAADFAVNLKPEAGAWIETQDGKYRAYIFINKVVNTASNTGMTLSLKRLQIK